VDSFSLDENLTPRFTTISGLPPVGICGSGLIDLIATLVTLGLIASSGAFNPEADDRLTARMNGDRYHLSDNVFLTQKDVRQVQLAKAAVLTGTQVLLSEASVSPCDLEEIIVAGSFGFHLNPESLRRIGILPKGFQGQISFVGNSSLSGASLALLNQDVLMDMEQIRSRVTVLELAAHPQFRSQFVPALNF
jgi:uncharacterized 2Fe-2S/4Fe-4S cluster protein (DUF4445 family)